MRVLADDALPESGPCPTIIQRPIPFDDERASLTNSYLRHHNGSPAVSEVNYVHQMRPELVVLHWTAGRTVESAFNTFAPIRLRGRPGLTAAGAVNVSAHYLVAQDGTIYQMLPDTTVGRHVIGLNHVAIGIENVGGLSDMPLTEAQIQSNAMLVRCIVSRHDIKYLIGHHEYRELEGTPLFVESDPNYRTRKIDPGDDFMTAVRSKLTDLGLLGPPK
jgi:N-acetylmuramoyl-L-alanine amidase